MKVFIGCSSREEIKDIYKEKANKLGEYLSKNNHDLLVGGIDGLMGIIIKKFKKYKRNIKVICVKNYYDNISNNYNKLNFNNVNERKNYIINEADIFLFIPGGIGTIDEIFSTIETKRAKQHNKPIIIININGYYDELKNTIDKIYKEKFAGKENSKLYNFFNDLDDVYKYIERCDINE